jgi:CheY-like chemotaxis protein
MPDGGTITITSRLIAASADKDEHVEISVADTGHGMDVETAARIFEPFFTTKERGKGTGLGLSTAFGFVQASGGEIEVETAPGVGTTMFLRFPVSRRPVAAAGAAVRETPRGLGETILLVEDNEPVLQLIDETLTALGYTVLPAPSGFEALEITEETDGVIDLLLTDVVMPGLSGIEVAKIVHARRPDTKIVFMSGYTDATRKTGQMPGGATLLQKPVDLRHLAEVIRGELAGLKLPKAG